MKEKNMQRKIHKALNEIGVPCGLLGRDYIEIAVEIILQKGRQSITHELYPAIAKKVGSKAHRVERAIRHAIERTFEIGNLKSIEECFGNAISLKSGKLANGDFLYGVVKHIQIYG